MNREYILIDYENVQPDDFELPAGIDWRILVFVGAKQKRLSLKLHKQRVEIIPMNGNGRNALDFHIAFALGALSERDPKARFHIVSKDNDYDLLLASVKKKGLRCARVESLNATFQQNKTASTNSTKEPNAETAKPINNSETAKPTTNAKVPASIQALVPIALKWFAKSGTARPKKVTSLKNSIGSHFQLKEKAVERLFDELVRQKHIVVEKDSLRYSLKKVASNAK